MNTILYNSNPRTFKDNNNKSNFSKHNMDLIIQRNTIKVQFSSIN